MINDEFQVLALRIIEDFFEKAQQHSYHTSAKDIGIKLKNIKEYNTGHGMGYLEGYLLACFSMKYDRNMTTEEYMELQTMLNEIGPRFKKMIFKKKNVEDTPTKY